jgi:hypothetical protein
MKKLLLKIIPIVFLAFSIFLTPNISLAQTESDIDVKTSPSIPEPGQRLVVTLESFSVNLTDSNIRWFANGQVIKEGEGVNSISFIAPNDSLRLVVQIITPEKSELIKSINISASSVDMLWEAPDTYAPPFYKGKSLPGPESLVKFVAIPSASPKLGQSGTKQVNFIWQRNSQVSGSSNGKGRDSYTILMDSLKNSELVEVATSYVGKVASAENEFKPFDLNLSIYPLSSGGEPFITRALRSGDSINRESSFFAAPYGAHPKYLDSKNIKFSWSVANSNISPSSRPFLITLSPNNNSDQNLQISYEIIKSLFDGFYRTYQLKI